MKFTDSLAIKAISSGFRLEILNSHCRELAHQHHRSWRGKKKKKKKKKEKQKKKVRVHPLFLEHKKECPSTLLGTVTT